MGKITIHFRIIFFFGIIILLFSCKNSNSEGDIIRLLNSEDKTEIIKGSSLLKSKKDTGFVKYLFRNIEDGRISHDIDFYGITVHQSTIGALSRISGLTPPNRITHDFDSVNTAYYRKWAIERKFIK